jgi:protein tyrosine phosphatase (PTP) superfamily phosphohydrolase (DUF442 family)
MKRSILLGVLTLASSLLTGCGSSGLTDGLGGLLGGGASKPLGSSGSAGGRGLAGSLSSALPGLLNANGGKLDKAVNDVMQRFEWRKSALPNFDQVNATLYRGGQPRPDDGWQELSRRGIRRVINLRYEDQQADRAAAQLGMEVINIPIPDTGVPTRDQVRQFRAAIAGGVPTFVHCSAGKFRTSTMCAIAKIDAGATAEEALADARAHGWKDDWMDSPKEAAFIRSYAANPSAWR